MCGVFLLVALTVADVCLGSVFIPLRELWATEGISHHILLDIRLPKALTAIMAGMALSVSGLMMQTLFRNPLAGPYILGVSSGASLGVAILTMCSTLLGVSLSGLSGSGIVLAGVSGSVLVLVLVMLVSRRIDSTVSLLIVGVMFGSIAGALVNLIQCYANPDALKLFVLWTLGSLSSVGWSQLSVLMPLMLVGLVLAVCLIKPLNGLMLGDHYARGLGVRVERVRLMIVLATGILAGGITAYCGPIAFVGVAVPHIARGLSRTSDHRFTLPLSALIGADLLLLCDVLSSLFTHAVPISTMSALFGAPIILHIILSRRTS